MRINNNKSPLLWFGFLMTIVFIVSILGPSEATLGSSARIVYLHGAWVWVSLFAFIAAGAAGLLSLYIWVTIKNYHQQVNGPVLLGERDWYSGWHIYRYLYWRCSPIGMVCSWQNLDGVSLSFSPLAGRCCNWAYHFYPSIGLHSGTRFLSSPFLQP